MCEATYKTLRMLVNANPDIMEWGLGGDLLAHAAAWEQREADLGDAIRQASNAATQLARELIGAQIHIEGLERPCPGCGHTLAQCYDDNRTCCPDCNHSQGAFHETAKAWTALAKSSPPK